MRLEYRDLVIRHAGKNDAPLLCRWWNDGAVMAHAGFPKGLGTTTEKIEKDLATDTNETRRRLIVEYQGKPIGEMCYRNENGAADIGIKICECEYQERGLGRVLLSMLIGYLFDSGYTGIVLDTDLQNARAQHVYEKLGFRKTAVNLDCWKDQLGNLRSSVSYELTQTDFVDFTQRKTAEEMWAAYISEYPEAADSEYEAWAYGDAPDGLAHLTVDGIKTATASAYPLYELERESLPVAGEHSVILWADGSAACIVKTTKVYVTPYKDISAEQAFKEGEGDRSLAYWRSVHEEFFRNELKSAGMEFTEDMPVVCEEFEVVFK